MMEIYNANLHHDVRDHRDTTVSWALGDLIAVVLTMRYTLAVILGDQFRSRASQLKSSLIQG